MSMDRERIRALNDELRRHLLSGGVIMTPGIANLGPEAVNRLVKVIARFDDFTEENDPYGELDFGAVAFEHNRVFFKIDYYDQELKFRSPDPSDPAVTQRVMTIMLASEY